MIKKLLIIALACAVCVPLAAKGKKKNEKEGDKTFVLADRTDSLSYCLGFANGGMMLKERLRQDFGLDSTQYATFVKELSKGAECSDPKKVAKVLGFYHGLLMRKDRMDKMLAPMFAADTTLHVDRGLLIDVLQASFTNDSMQMDAKQVNDYMSGLQRELQAKAMDRYKADNEAFLADNARRDSVVTTASGLQYKVLTAGTGPVPSKDSKVKVNYRGMTIDGKEFDSSYKRGVPTEFTPQQVIKGWAEALTMMPIGSRWMIYIPQELGYGSRGAGPIKPYSTLIFELELLEIVK